MGKAGRANRCSASGRPVGGLVREVRSETTRQVAVTNAAVVSIGNRSSADSQAACARWSARAGLLSASVMASAKAITS